MRSVSTASFAKNEPTQAFQTARMFDPGVVCVNITPVLYHGLFVAYACVVFRVPRQCFRSAQPWFNNIHEQVSGQIALASD